MTSTASNDGLLDAQLRPVVQKYLDNTNAFINDINLLGTQVPPSGGAIGEVLTKVGSGDYEFGWGPGGGGGGGGGEALASITPLDAAYGATGDGVADDSDEVENCITDAVSGNRTVSLAGAKYRITRPLGPFTGGCTIKDGELYLDPSVDPAGVGMLGFDVNHTGEFAIVALTTESHTFPDATVSTTVTKLELNLGHTVTEGQFVKVFSSDPAPWLDGFGRVAEPAYVVEVDGAFVYLSHKLFYHDTYATTPKVAVYNKLENVVLDNVRFTGNWTALLANEWHYSHVTLKGLVAPQVKNCFFSDMSNAGLDVQNCVLHSVYACEFTRGWNRVDLANPIYGYGMKDTGAYGSIFNLLGADVRHLYTCGEITDVTSDWDLFGWALANTINGTATACSSSAFDTHRESDRITFRDCKSFQPYRGPEAADAGLQVRSPRTTVLSFQSDGPGIGILLNKEADVIELPDIVIDSHIHRGTGRAINLSDSGSSGSLQAEIRTPYWLQTGGLEFLQTCERSNVILDRPTARAGFDTATFRCIRAQGGTLTVMGGIWDVTGMTTVSPEFLQFSEANGVYDIDTEVLSPTATNIDGVLTRTSGDTNDVTATLRVRLSKVPASTDGLKNISAGSTILHDLLYNDRQLGASSEKSISSTGGTTTLDLSRHGADAVTFRYTITTADLTITSAVVSPRKNQVATIFNDETSTHDLIINHNAPGALIMGGSAITVAPGNGIVIREQAGKLRLASANVAASPGTTIDVAEDGVVAASVTVIDFLDYFDVSAGGEISIKNILTNPAIADHDHADFVLRRPKLKDYCDNVGSALATSGAITPNYTDGPIFDMAQNGNATINPPSSPPADGGWILIRVARSNVAHTISFGANIRLATGSSPTWSANGRTDYIYLSQRGSLWDASFELGYQTA